MDGPSQATEHEIVGPWGWRNARSWHAGESSSRAIELACYTDLRSPRFEPTSAGPFTVMPVLQNFDLFEWPGLPQVGVVIRIEQHLGDDDSPYYLDEDWDQNDPVVHHGGNAGQELAALTSLMLGIRLREGGLLRVFDSHRDRGHPHAPNLPPPYLPVTSDSPILPYHSQRYYPFSRDLVEIDTSRIQLLNLYSNLSRADALALVRAARSYQEAVWVADGDPRQAWLRLVTAVEVVAQLMPDAPAAGRLSAVFPQIADKVARLDDPELTEWITVKFADQGRSTAKFIDFLMRFRPPAPPRRPAISSPYRLDWKGLRKQLNHIYAYRSKDLHRGVPFPQVMCEPPPRTSRGIPHEVARGDKSWRGEPPMHLHMFEYIVRGALQSWWRKTASSRGSAKG